MGVLIFIFTFVQDTRKPIFYIYWIHSEQSENLIVFSLYM